MSSININTYEEYESLVKGLLREQLAAITESDFNHYFELCKKDIEKDFNREESAGASMLAYALGFNY